MKSRLTLIQTIVVCFVLCPLALGQDLASFEKRTTVKKLANGLTIIICERPEAPVFSFFTHVDAGSVQDPMGKTGLAHMFEHMAFKGTDTIGTRDYAGEKVALAKVETAYAAYIAERDLPVGRDEQKLKQLEQNWKDAIAAADKFSAAYNNEFGKIVESEGGEGMNAFTNLDETGYHYSFPINRLELWAYLESERFLLRRIIEGADLVRSFERHVLEHVRQAAFTFGILHIASVHVCEERENGSLWTFQHHQGQSVGQFLDRDSLFERGDVLRQCRRKGEHDEKQQKRESTSHAASERQTINLGVNVQTCQITRGKRSCCYISNKR